MSKKSPKIAALLLELTANGQTSKYDPHYLGYFECFNRQMYYEAHDVLEELWLGTKGELHLFYKGLIQLAGAFVHLKKSKLNPGARLFRLAQKNLQPYAPECEGFGVDEILGRVGDWLRTLETSDYSVSPYDPAHPPKLSLGSQPRMNAKPRESQHLRQ